MASGWGRRVAITVLMVGANQAGSSQAAQSGDSFACIAMDGRFDDWASVPAAVVDPVGDAGRSAVDIQRVWLANDERYLYLRVEVEPPVTLQALRGPMRIYFDLDRSAATGYRVGPLGSDFALLLPERYGTLQTADDFEAQVIPHAKLDLMWNPTMGSRQFELRIARDARVGTPARQLFAAGDFDVLLAARPLDGEVHEWAPDSPRALTYAFQPGACPAVPIPDLARQDSRHIRFVTYNMLWDGLWERPEFFDRILRALEPDMICFQESRKEAEDTARRMNEILPLPGGRTWQAHQGRRTVLVSRWSLSRRSELDAFMTGAGQAMGLVDLPDERFPRDLYVVATHYTCCGTMDDADDRDRQRHSDGNVAWLRDLREPGGELPLPTGTPMVVAGDLNLVGSPRVLLTLLTGDVVDEARYGPDTAPDWDGSPLKAAIPMQTGAAVTATWQNPAETYPPARFDYVIYTDSVLTAARSFVLNTALLPEAVLKAHGLRACDTAEASDHLPVVVDFAFPPSH